ncbi:NAD(P)H nitroreductase [Paractinoplanes abujensis]|uniref:Nitroreductase n=1 Tax=Paractinoplanes abujensis TaxID=882441 RepID=A0A7W7CSF0_9ACTN|nr:nitroreductase family protein [Actinoplanes abujensis]MBB4693484.1 nitroreductase [Actinoplanes abujensis]GID21858.1 NAD(P)H nitroreductase [Actinoplanes abujensis]
MTTTIAPPVREVLLDCVRTATAAPSLHNSQPWKFQVRGGRVDVYADPSRRLHVLDPDGREQLMSVGAAVFTLRLAIRNSGYRSDFTLFPEADEPGLVARVIVTRPSPVTRSAEALAAAVPHRHTNRWPFAQIPVPRVALDRLRDAARREGAVLATANPAGRDAVLRLARFADAELRRRPGYRDELARWTGGSVRNDGVPLRAAGPWDALEYVPMRDFTEASAQQRTGEPFEPYPTILVLATDGDRRVDGVRAGQALQRVLLTATWQDLATTPISQPVEVPSVRRLLIEPGSGLFAQMILRVGYGRGAEGSPRRPLSEVLLPSRPGDTARRRWSE